MIATPSDELARRLAAYESQMSELQEQLKIAEEEVAALRHRLAEAPDRKSVV